MKQTTKASTCLLAVMAITMIAAFAANAAAPALNGQLVLRPLTPGDKTVYNLPSSMEVSGGLTTVGIGTAVYPEVEVNSAIAPSSIVSVTWSLTNNAGSQVALTSSPLGTNVPVYNVNDRGSYQVVDRKLLRPDLVGQYTLVATIIYSPTNNVFATNSVTQTINAATYMGINTCALCHSGGVIAEDKYHPWINTAHSQIFTEGINGQIIENGAPFYSASCLSCHTVGYDTNTNAVNGGFDDMAKQAGWVFPTNLVSTNWAYMQSAYPSVANVANIQCENCHGPGSLHASHFGDTNLISKTVNSGDCNQCHDAPSHHIYGTEWYASRHAQTTGPTSASCLPCHSANGFIARANGTNTNYAITPTPNVAFAPISCQTCHEPHGETVPTNNPHLVRVLGSVTMPDSTVVTNAGFGAICLECHQNRNGSATNQLVNYPIGKPTWFGGSSFGVHDNPQGDMIEGINAFTYGQAMPSSAHRYAVTNLCVGCHMQPLSANDPGLYLAGGHTWNMSYSLVTTNGTTLVTNSYDKVDVCVQCHGPIDSFDMPRQDYNGDGVIEGVQTEVQHLLDKLSTMLPNATYQANSNNYLAAGIVQTIDRTYFKTNWPPQFLKAGYNWQFVANDGSLGVHNAPFAVGILRASIADLSGDSNNDGLPDSWQITYFGSATNALAAPNATPAGDGVPNWMKYLLGLNPLLPGISVTNGLSVGVVWASGNNLNNPYGATNTVQIYTAAEVAFETEVGKNYQIQAASSLSRGWQNIGNPIPGTGSTVSYVTPTRQNVQQFYRVYSY